MKPPEKSREARALLLSQRFGVLSTHSREVAGYPFGSVVPYCLDRAGRPVLLISDIAQHTRNIQADPRVALTLLDPTRDDVQANGRLTLLGDARPVEGDLEETAERYYRYFPPSRDYHLTHGFYFFRLEPVRIRYIGGFGNIRWLQPSDFLAASPFPRPVEDRMLAHMNADHQPALAHYLALEHGVTVEPGAGVTMVGIDAEGIDLLHGGRLYRVALPEPVATAEEARGALVEMARRAVVPAP